MLSRNKICKTALSLFASRGYDATTVEMVASTAGVSKGLVYNYFENKEELLIESFMEAFEHLEQAFGEQAVPESPQKTVQLFIDGLFDYFTEHVGFWRLQASIMMQPSVPQRLRTAMMDKLRSYITLFEQLFAASGIPDAKGEAWILAASLDGTMLYYMFAPDECPLDTIRKNIMFRYEALFSSSHPREELS